MYDPKAKRISYCGHVYAPISTKISKYSQQNAESIEGEIDICKRVFFFPTFTVNNEFIMYSTICWGEKLCVSYSVHILHNLIAQVLITNLLEQQTFSNWAFPIKSEADKNDSVTNMGCNVKSVKRLWSCSLNVESEVHHRLWLFESCLWASPVQCCASAPPLL